MQCYLPAILINSFGVRDRPHLSSFIRQYVAEPIVKICRTLKIKSLPIKGHTHMVIARKIDNSSKDYVRRSISSFFVISLYRLRIVTSVTPATSATSR